MKTSNSGISYDTAPGLVLNSSFRTVGYGHDFGVWKDMVSTLRVVGYDYVMSIEHEDSLMSGPEGLRKAVQFLKAVMLEQPRGAMWWD